MAGMLLSGARPVYAAIYQFVVLAMIFASVPEMAAAVAGDAARGDLVLVKASRGMRLEQVVERLVPGREDAARPLATGGRS